MTNRTRTGILLLVLAQGLAGCRGSGSSPAPSAPSPVPKPAPPPIPSPNDDAFIKGTVRDTAFRPLAGAIVEIVDGPQAGTSATLDATGEFSLTGTFDDTTRFRATKEGHVAVTGTLNPSCAICHPHRWIHFYLDVLAPPVNIAGDYTLTFVADRACANFPDEMRTRTYAATIAPGSKNTLFNVTLSGAPFLDNRMIYVGVAGDFIAFGLSEEDGAVLVEQVAPNAYLEFAGGVEASVGTAAISTIATSFDGFIDYCVLRSERVRWSYDCILTQAVAHARCVSKNHRLILTRR